jgi:hypothetical protein
VLCCIVLHCTEKRTQQHQTAMHCSVLYYCELYHNFTVLSCILLCRRFLNIYLKKQKKTFIYCSDCTELYWIFSTLLYNTVLYYTVIYCAVLDSTELNCTVYCTALYLSFRTVVTVLYFIILYSTLLPVLYCNVLYCAAL